MKRELDQNSSHGSSTHCGQQAGCANENCTRVKRTSGGSAGNCSDDKAEERGGYDR